MCVCCCAVAIEGIGCWGFAGLRRECWLLVVKGGADERV